MTMASSGSIGRAPSPMPIYKEPSRNIRRVKKKSNIFQRKLGGLVHINGLLKLVANRRLMWRCKGSVGMRRHAREGRWRGSNKGQRAICVCTNSLSSGRKMHSVCFIVSKNITSRKGKISTRNWRLFTRQVIRKVKLICGVQTLPLFNNLIRMVLLVAPAEGRCRCPSAPLAVCMGHESAAGSISKWRVLRPSSARQDPLFYSAQLNVESKSSWESECFPRGRRPLDIFWS